MDERAQQHDAEAEEEATGLLRLSVSGSERVVPELKWRENRKWKALLKETFTRLADTPSDSPDGQDAMLDAEREMVMAYDVTRALGDLEDATETDIDRLFNRLVTVAYPLAASPAAVMMEMVREVVQAMAGASHPASSTSSASPSGDSRPTPSRRRSPSGRSPSSTGTRRSA